MTNHEGDHSSDGSVRPMTGQLITDGFKFVAPDLTTRRHTFSYLDALRNGDWVEATGPFSATGEACPDWPGDGLCVAHTVRAACSGGQRVSNAVGLLVAYAPDDVLGADDGKVRVRRLKVTGVFDPLWLISQGLVADLAGADLTRADLTRADLTGADLAYANLIGADLAGANLTDADLAGANLTGANLTGANLTGATLIGASLIGASLIGANLTGANLTRASLTYAYLIGADLTDANLTGANLTYADLTGATLIGADLTGANLTGANLARANLTGANLTDTKGLPS